MDFGECGWHCMTEIRKDFLERDAIHLAAYVCPKPVHLIQHWWSEDHSRPVCTEISSDSLNLLTMLCTLDDENTKLSSTWHWEPFFHGVGNVFQKDWMLCGILRHLRHFTRWFLWVFHKIFFSLFAANGINKNGEIILILVLCITGVGDTLFEHANSLATMLYSRAYMYSCIVRRVLSDRCGCCGRKLSQTKGVCCFSLFSSQAAILGLQQNGWNRAAAFSHPCLGDNLYCII